MLKEYTRPLEEPIEDDVNVFSLLEDRVERLPDDSLIEYKNHDGSWGSFDATHFKSKVTELAKGLIAKGIMPGDAVSILSRNRWEWTALDLAILSIGAVCVPLYETNSPSQVKRVLNDSHVVMIFVEDDDQREKLDLVRSQCAYLNDVYVITRGALGTIAAYGKGVSDAEFAERAEGVNGGDLATIVYTSGSMSSPKGIELSHSNIVFTVKSGIQAVPEICLGDGRRLLLFLPLGHAFARCLQFFAIGTDLTLGISSSLKTLLQDMQSFKPTFFLAVPRVFEKIYNAASQKAGSGTRGHVFLDAARVARQASVLRQKGEEASLSFKARYAFYKTAVYEDILDVMGGRVQYAISGGAPLDLDVARFFDGIGLPVLEGYGLTETMGPIAVNPVKGYRIGSIGQPMPGVSMGVDEEGELCVKSPSVCLGYHNHPELTHSQVVDGWLHTGDLGRIDDDGFVTLTGRKKEIIITAGGKNVSPGILESAVLSSPVISQCLVIGDRRPFISALITLDLDATNNWLHNQGAEPVADLKEARANPIVVTEVERAVDAANMLVSQAESIRRFEILDEDFTQEEGLLTPSFKPRRAEIVKRYAELIDRSIYAGRKGA